MGVEGRRRLWSIYGWFSALMCGGSVLWAAAWAVRPRVPVAPYSPTATTVDTVLSQPRIESGLSAFVVVCAFEFFFLSVNKLLVLHRMTDFAFSQQTRLQRQLIGISTVVFFTLLLRFIFSSMFALKNVLQNGDANCPVPCDRPCFNAYLLIQRWLLFTPEFQLSVILKSSRLSLLVALWGMTSERMLQLMESSSRSQLQQGVLQCSRED
jgi:hypothetical protein